jgi:hypothetical protein
MSWLPEGFDMLLAPAAALPALVPVLMPVVFVAGPVAAPIDVDPLPAA